MEVFFFYALAALTLICSFLTVSSNNILRAAVYLLIVLASTAGLYFMMNFNFLAAVQLTVYAGGIVVLIIFSILLTHQINTRLELPLLSKRITAGVVSVIPAIIALWAIHTTEFKTTDAVVNTSLDNVGSQLMGLGVNGYVLPFEVISVLLLAAMVAAIIVAKKFIHD